MMDEEKRRAALARLWLGAKRRFRFDFKGAHLMDEDGHETGLVERWPDDVLRDDHPTPSEGDCVSSASVEAKTTPTYAALAEVWD